MSLSTLHHHKHLEDHMSIHAPLEIAFVVDFSYNYLPLTNVGKSRIIENRNKLFLC